MTKINAISPRNAMAISAMLMLSVGTSHAQDVTVPVAQMPVAAAPVVTAAPIAPTIVIPTPTSEPVIAPAVAEPVSPPATQAPPAREATRTASREVAREPAPVRTDTAMTPVVPAPAAEPVPTPVAAPAPASTERPIAAAPVAADNSAPDWAVPVGAAATLLVLGGVGLAFSRRRRAYEEDVDFVPPIAARPTLKSQPECRVAPPMPPALATIAMSPAIARTASEREALIERIVASPPDEANPFHSRKARRRRARIMVQSMAAHSEAPTSRTAQVTPEAQGKSRTSMMA